MNDEDQTEKMGVGVAALSIFLGVVLFLIFVAIVG